MLLALEPPIFHVLGDFERQLNEHTVNILQKSFKLFTCRRNAIFNGEFCRDCDIVCLLNYLSFSLETVTSSGLKHEHFKNASRTYHRISSILGRDIQHFSASAMPRGSSTDYINLIGYYVDQANLNPETWSKFNQKNSKFAQICSSDARTSRKLLAKMCEEDLKALYASCVEFARFEHCIQSSVKMYTCQYCNELQLRELYRRISTEWLKARDPFDGIPEVVNIILDKVEESLSPP